MKTFVFVVFTINKEESRGWVNIGYLSSYLRQRKDIDVVIKFYNLDEVKNALSDIFIIDPFAIGLTVLQNNFYSVLDFSGLVKDKLPFTTIILGNIEATEHADYIMERYPSVDLIVRGEGEITLYEVCDRLLSGKSLIDCPGILCRIGDDIVKTEPRKLVENLDSLPYPDNSFYENCNNSFSIIGARGCRGSCSFCAVNSIYKANVGSCFRERSIENILGEIEVLVNEKRQGFFRFWDSAFDNDYSVKRLKKLYELLSKSNLRITFMIYSSAKMITEAYISEIIRLQEVGLVVLFIGIESGSRSDLSLYGKNIDDNENALSLLTRHNFLSGQRGLFFKYGFISFNPYSTIQSLKENVTFLEKHKLHVTMEQLMSRLYVSNSAPITKKIIRDGLLTQSPELPILDEFCYKFKDNSVEQVYRILKDIYERYPFFHTLNIPASNVLLKITLNNKVSQMIIDPTQTLITLELIDQALLNIFKTILMIVESSNPVSVVYEMIMNYQDSLKDRIREMQLLNAKLAVRLYKDGNIVL